MLNCQRQQDESIIYIRAISKIVLSIGREVRRLVWACPFGIRGCSPYPLHNINAHFFGNVRCLSPFTDDPTVVRDGTGKVELLEQPDTIFHERVHHDDIDIRRVEDGRDIAAIVGSSGVVDDLLFDFSS